MSIYVLIYFLNTHIYIYTYCREIDRHVGFIPIMSLWYPRWYGIFNLNKSLEWKYVWKSHILSTPGWLYKCVGREREREKKNMWIHIYIYTPVYISTFKSTLGTQKFNVYIVKNTHTHIYI